jgi:hypothetical protein
MKKVLLIGFVLAILLLAFPQGVLAAEPDTATGSAVVSAEITSYITLAVTPPPTWELEFDANECGTGDPTGAGCNQLADAIKFDISSNDGWTLNVLQNSANDGYLKSGSEALQNRLFIGPDTGGIFVDAHAAHPLQTGPKTTATGVSHYKTLRQKLDILDNAALTGYTITLDFNVVTTT